MQAKPPHHVILDKDFAGIPKGSKLHISCPIEVAAELKTITPGSTLSIQAFRRRLAEKNNCDATCPVSTSLFLRIVAEHAWEEYNRTGSTRDVAPFWRVLQSSSPMAKKLSFDPAWIDLQREIESREVCHSQHRTSSPARNNSKSALGQSTRLTTRLSELAGLVLAAQKRLFN